MEPLIVNYGGGVDSTAMLVGFVARGIRPALILFADTGAEKPETYDYVRLFSEWLEGRGFPAITTVRRYGQGGEYGPTSRASKTGPGYSTIEGNCIQNRTLPSLAFGMKSCSLKWKAEPMDAWLAKWAPAVEAWARGEKPTKAIGYDCSPADERRAHGRTEDASFRFWYPLRDWGWDRHACVAAIRAAGLPVPVKSACFFCPASKAWELRWLAAEHPELFKRALALEDNARPGLKTVEGLWRTSTKTRPGSWRAWAEAERIVAPGTTEIVATPEALRAAAAVEMPDTAGSSQAADVAPEAA